MDWNEWHEQDWAKELRRHGYAVPSMHPDAKATQLTSIMDCLQRNFPEQFSITVGSTSGLSRKTVSLTPEDPSPAQTCRNNDCASCHNDKAP